MFDEKTSTTRNQDHLHIQNLRPTNTNDKDFELWPSCHLILNAKGQSLLAKLSSLILCLDFHPTWTAHMIVFLNVDILTSWKIEKEPRKRDSRLMTIT
jgi:hypothetical protein